MPGHDDESSFRTAKASFGRMEPRVCREHGLLPLPAGERGGVRGFTIEVLVPLTPTLSPLGRGSPAVPQIEAVLITKVWIEMNGTCFRSAMNLGLHRR